MSTRSFIGFYDASTGNIRNTSGVYHHSDGYPSGVGQKLYHLAQVYDNTRIDRFTSGLDILRDLLFEHPSGYSYILDWSGAPEDLIGYDQYEAIMDTLKPNYPDFMQAYEARSNMGLGKYYDGEREIPDAKLLKLYDAYESWCEYAYIIYPTLRLMAVLTLGQETMTKIGVVDFDAPIPEFLKE